MNNIKKLTIFTLLFLALISTISNVVIVSALAPLTEHFNEVNNIEFYSKLILSIPSFIMALLAPVLGHIVFKFGKKRSTIVALTVFTISGSGGLYLDSIDALLLSRAVLGVSLATLMIVSTSLVGDYFKGENRYKYMSNQHMFVALGGILFMIVGGYLSDISWRYSFGIYLLGLFILPFAISQLKEVKVEIIEEKENVDVSKKIYFVYFFAFVYMVIFFILPTQIPFLLNEVFNASATLVGSIIAISFLGNAFGAFAFAKLKARFSFGTIFTIALISPAIGLIGLGTISNVNLFYLPVFILGFGGGIMMTNLTSWMLSFTTLENRVKSSGYFTSSLFLGQFASPLVFQIPINYLGVQNFLVSIGLSLGAIVVISFFIIILKTKNAKQSLSI